MGAGRGRLARLGLLALLAAVAALLFVPSLASAEFTFCPEGEGAGQCGTGIEGIATDDETGHVYVADEDNNRVDAFEADGTFLFAFGWGVDTGAAKFETCTTASGCQKGIAGAGAGQLFRASLVAVDNAAASPSRHRIYVSSSAGDSNRRVDAFEADGTFLFSFGTGVDTGAEKFETCTAASTCQKGVESPGAWGLFDVIKGIAVDSAGSVNVVDSKFNGNAGKHCPYEGLLGTEYANEFENRVQKFSAAGKPIESFLVSEPPCGPVARNTFAIGPAGEIYLASEGGANALRKYTAGGTALCSGESNVEINGIAVDSSGNLFLAENEGRNVELGEAGGNPQITELNSSCEPVRAFGYNQTIFNKFGRSERYFGLAFHHDAEGEIFAANLGINHLGFPPAGPIVNRQTGRLGAKPVGNVRATILGEANPEGEATEVHAQYVDQESYEEAGFGSLATQTTEAASLKVGEGKQFKMNLAEVLVGCPEASKQLIEEGKCLTPETTYRFRLIATNEDNPTGKGEGTAEGSFTTKAPLEIEDTYAAGVGADTATLGGRVNPLGIPATGEFEYVDDATYQESGFGEASRIAVDFGSAEAPTRRSASLYPLQPATLYHYRLAVTDPLIEGARLSKAKTFRTFAIGGGPKPCPENEALRVGFSAQLPDCRAYEMVSPVDKEGGDIAVLLQEASVQPAVLNQSAASGEALTYGSSRAFGDAASASLTTQYIAARDPGMGWQTHAITPPQGESIKGAAEFDFEFKAFSADLCEAWIVPFAEPVLAEGAPPGYFNLYRRSDALCGDQGYEAISTGRPQTFPEFNGTYGVEAQGFSADGQVAAFSARDSLEGTAAPAQPEGCEAPSWACSKRLYTKAAGQPLRYACILPSGEPYGLNCQAGTGADTGFRLTRYGSVVGALSADGKKLFWSGSASSSEGPIYLRENPSAPDSAHLHGQASGHGDLVGPVAATGNLNATTTVKKVKVSSGSFVAGQAITGPEGIAAGTTIAKIEGEGEEEGKPLYKLTLSKAATKVKTGAALEGIASSVVANAVAEAGAFAAGQEISAGASLPTGTTIVKVEEPKAGVFELTLSAGPTRGGIGVALWSSSECTEADKACAIRVSAKAEAKEGSNASFFWAGAGDGSRAIFETGGSLYEFDVESEVATKIAGRTLGVLGAGDNDARVYFLSEEILTGEEANEAGQKAAKGKPNLYFHEAGEGGGVDRFIGTVMSGDALPRPNVTSLAAQYSWLRNARVSPDGLHAAFMSSAPLSGYDNTDAASGEADAEVFLYDAKANELICASCSPSGGRPTGQGIDAGSKAYWFAGRLPRFATTLYASRVLSEDGSRLFFESTEPLVPRDTNGKIDVYEWERLGTGGCDEADSTYSNAQGGCVDLISTGQSAKDSSFVDASADGRDVFFTTVSSLVPQDLGLIDIYDAREGGGFPPPATPAAACEGEACQSAPEAPNDPTPASESFEGAGNVHEEAPVAKKPRHCAKGKVKRHGRCVRRHMRHAKKHRKRLHRRRAHNSRRAGR